MAGHKRTDVICLAAAFLAVVLTVLFINGKALGLKPMYEEQPDELADSPYFSAADISRRWQGEAATDIQLSDKGVKVSGSGVYVLDDDIHITRSGIYRIAGIYTKGAVVVDADAYAVVRLVLDNADITCADDACIRIEQADKTIISLADNSISTLYSNVYESHSGGIDAALFARDDLTINGEGTLRIESLRGHGIKANDDLVITGGNIEISSRLDGIHAHDSFRFARAGLTAEAGDEGIAVSGEEGYFYLHSGHLEIDAVDDGIHTAGRLEIDGGTITMEAGDDGLHADTAVIVNDGEIDIRECHEGIEAPAIEVHGGSLAIVPYDDGMNANNGAGVIAIGGLSNTDSERTMPYILIEGGDITIANDNAYNADGLDSNGDLFIHGGSLRIFLNQSGQNAVFDYGYEFGGRAVIDGGTLIGAASLADPETFGFQSRQASLLYTVSEGVRAGSPIALKDENDSILLEETVPCDVSLLLLSCPQMKTGGSYRLAVNGREEDIRLSGIASVAGDVRLSLHADRHSGLPVLSGPVVTVREETDASAQYFLFFSIAVLLAGLGVAAFYPDRLK